MGAAEFARRLGELKERSGLSYGTLAKRLHMGTSTVHRYVNGAAVPQEFAPVERFARVCRATPDEVVELHRLWILADAARGRAGHPEPVPGDAGERPAEDVRPVRDVPADVLPEGVPAENASPEHVPPERPEGARQRERRTLRRRVAVGCGVVAAAGALVAGVLAVGGDPGGDGKQPAGAAEPTTAASGNGGEGPSPEAGADRGKGGSAEKAPDVPDHPGESQAGGPAAGGASSPPDSGGTPVTARVRPYIYEDPCSQRFLVDREPTQLPQPPGEPEAPSWVSAFGAVPAGEQLVEVTLQGTGKQTVVLESVRVRVAGTRAPLAWNDYGTGVGCGGVVRTQSFAVDLDAPRPEAVPANGQRDFPYKVSESDPEVFVFKADVQRRDVTWYLELGWSSGGRHGVLRVDDKGRPFRTSGSVGRSQYDWPLGGDDRWEKTPQG